MKKALSFVLLVACISVSASTVMFKGYPLCSDLAEMESFDLFDRYCGEDSQWSAADICADLVENERIEYDRYCVGKSDITLDQ